MIDPILKHSYVQLNGSLVHLVQYGTDENVIQSRAKSQPHDSTLSATRSTASNNSSRATEISDTRTGHNVSKTSSKSSDKFVIFVPGNPGMLGMYHDFLSALFRTLNSEANKNPDERLTILAMSHNNFDHPAHVQYPSEERISIEENELNFVEKAVAQMHSKDPHHVELQILNKLIILKRLLKLDFEDCKLVFIGHSIGCYVIIRMLQDRLIESAHEGSVLIHPALENLALTEKGSYFNWLFNYKIDLLMRSAAFIVDSLLPNFAKLTVAKWFCSPKFIKNSSEMAIESVTQLCCGRTLKALIEMAKSEFANVKNIDPDAMIKPYVNKLKLIYAINDHWVNGDNRRLLKELYPDLYMEEQTTLHAFIMDPDTVMDYAVKVGVFVKSLLDNSNKS